MINLLNDFVKGNLRRICREIILEVLKENNNEHYRSVIVSTEDEIIRFSNKGYDCQQIGANKWLMRRKINSTKEPNVEVKGKLHRHDGYGWHPISLKHKWNGR